ncbi:MAG: diguanylate cyclase [Sedimenticola sp.]
MKKYDPIVRQYKKAITTTILGLVCISTIIGVVAVWPFYINLKAQSEDEFQRFGTSLQKQIQYHIDGFADIANQVTSRTKARNTLVDFINGKVDYTTANRVIEDILSDVPRRSPIVLGVMRFDVRGGQVASVGQRIPREFLESLHFSQMGVKHYTLHHEGKPAIFVVDAPIKDRQDQWVGNDVLLFNSVEIEETIRISTDSFPSSYIALSYNTNNAGHTLFRSGVDIKGDGVEELVSQSHTIGQTDLTMQISISKERLFALAKTEMTRMSLLLVSVLLLGCFGIYLLSLRFLQTVNQEVDLREAREDELLHLLTSLGAGVYGVDVQGKCTFINPAALAMLGFSEEETLGHDQHAMFHHHRKDGSHYPAAECPISLTLKDGIARNCEELFWRKDGSSFPVILTTTPKGAKGHQTGAVAVFRDISEQKKKESELRKEATTDPLTGAANRRLFINQLNSELGRYKRYGETVSIIMADIDHFKKINDTYGHAMGDEVLRHFTKLSKKFLRNADLFGRLGGEEFGLMLPVTNASEAFEFAERYRRAVSESPAPTEQGKISFTISLGITEFDLSDDTPDSALARADEGLYRAKEGGRNKTEVNLLEVPGRIAMAAGRSFIQLKWRASYACGEQSIDSEHLELFRLANALLDQATQSETASEGVQAAFDALLSHVAGHFTHEEAILREHGYSRLDEHAELHRQLVDHAMKLRQQVDEEGVPIGDLVNFLVSEVVVGHMLKEDRKFYDLFANDRL